MYAGRVSWFSYVQIVPKPLANEWLDIEPFTWYHRGLLDRIWRRPLFMDDDFFLRPGWLRDPWWYRYPELRPLDLDTLSWNRPPPFLRDSFLSPVKVNYLWKVHPLRPFGNVVYCYGFIFIGRFCTIYYVFILFRTGLNLQQSTVDGGDSFVHLLMRILWRCCFLEFFPLFDLLIECYSKSNCRLSKPSNIKSCAIAFSLVLCKQNRNGRNCRSYSGSTKNSIGLFYMYQIIIIQNYPWVNNTWCLPIWLNLRTPQWDRILLTINTLQ